MTSWFETSWGAQAGITLLVPVLQPGSLRKNFPTFSKRTAVSVVCEGLKRLVTQTLVTAHPSRAGASMEGLGVTQLLPSPRHSNHSSCSTWLQWSHPINAFFWFAKWQGEMESLWTSWHLGEPESIFTIQSEVDGLLGTSSSFLYKEINTFEALSCHTLV